MGVSGAEEFWKWSLTHYARKDVETLLMQLQDDFGFNVNIALWCCWCAVHYQTTPELALRNAIDQTGKWNTNVTGPLREVRRFLKAHRATKITAGEKLREQVKQAELDAEKEEQSRLERLAATALAPLGGGMEKRLEEQRNRARRNLAAYTALIGAAKRNRFTVSLLEELIESIFPMPPQKPANLE